MTHSNQRPERSQKLGYSLYAFNFDVKEIVNEETQETSYEYQSLIFDHAPSYAEVVNAAIKQNYPFGGDEAAIRKGVINSANAEFVAFNEFVIALKNKIRPEFYEEI